MNMKTAMWIALVMAGVVLAPSVSLAQEAEKIPVGIYLNLLRAEPKSVSQGYEGIKMGLEDAGFENVSYVNTLDLEKLKAYKVVIIPCVLAYPKEWDLNTVRENQRKYVENGGGLILCQESVGWRAKRVFKDNPPFPEIGRGAPVDGKAMYAPVQITPMEVVDKTHPVAQGLPDKVPYAYDLAPLKVGEKGKVILKLPEKAYVRGRDTKLDKDLAGVIVGELGKGRVVLMGPLVGLTRLPREMEKPPKGAELKLLINAVEWAAGGK